MIVKYVESGALQIRSTFEGPFTLLAVVGEFASLPLTEYSTLTLPSDGGNGILAFREKDVVKQEERIRYLQYGWINNKLIYNDTSLVSKRGHVLNITPDGNLVVVTKDGACYTTNANEMRMESRYVVSLQSMLKFIISHFLSNHVEEAQLRSEAKHYAAEIEKKATIESLQKELADLRVKFDAQLLEKSDAYTALQLLHESCVKERGERRDTYQSLVEALRDYRNMLRYNPLKRWWSASDMDYQLSKVLKKAGLDPVRPPNTRMPHH